MTDAKMTDEEKKYLAELYEFMADIDELNRLADQIFAACDEDPTRVQRLHPPKGIDHEDVAL